MSGLRGAVVSFFREGFAALGANHEVVPLLAQMRDRLAEVTASLALSQALCEATGHRLRALLGDEERWRQRSEMGAGPELTAHAQAAADSLRDEIFAISRLQDLCTEELEHGRERWLEARGAFGMLRARAGATRLSRLDPPEVDERLLDAARRYVAEHLDVEEILTRDSDHREFMERLFRGFEARLTQ